MEERKLYLEKVEQEVEKRVELLEQPDYIFVKKMSLVNKAFATAVGTLSFVSIIIAYQIWF